MDTVIQPEPAPTPAPEAPVAEAPAVETAAPVQETEDQKAQRLRDEKTGQFVKGKPEEKKEAPKVEAAAPAAPPKPKTPRPSSWKKELEAHWDTLPPEVQAYVQQREKQYTDGVSTYKTEADRGKAVMEAIAPFEPMLQQSKIPVGDWIRNLGSYHQILTSGSPQDKVQTVAQIISQNGVDARALFDVLTGKQPTYQPQALQQQQQPALSAADIEKAVDQRLMQKEVDAKFTAFTKGVEEGKYPHFEEVKGTMAGLLQSGLAEDYASAYESALAMPKFRHLQTPAPQADAPQAQPVVKEAEAKKAEAARARSQAVSVKSSTPSAMAPAADGKPKSIRESLSAAFEANTNRV